MRLPFQIAFRYLFARKSYQVINLISGIGAAGMAIGTAALIIILSVFNGFDALVASSLDDTGAPLSVRPVQGKVFVPESPALDWALASEQVERITSVLEDQVFVSYEGKQGLALARGMDEVAREESPLQEHLVGGEWRWYKGDLPQAVAGVSLAHTLGLSPRFVTPLALHYPSRTQAVSLSNPVASLRSVKVQLSGVISVNADIDKEMLLIPIELMRELLEYDTEVSSVDIWPAPGAEKLVKAQLQKRLDGQLKVLDRFEQNASIYRMMRQEKLAIYLILVFVVLLVAFNIYSSLHLLILEKADDRETLRALGAPEGLLKQIFLTEGWLVSLLGMTVGLVLGIGLVLLQQHFGLIPMPGNFVVSAYPVVLKASDILFTILGVGAIGFLMAWLPAQRMR